MEWNTPVTELRGVGEQAAQKLKTLGIHSVGDLLEHYPRRYEDYSLITPVAHISPGMVTIKAKIRQVSGRYVRRGMHITEAIASDSTGSVRLVWFNQPYRKGAIKSDTEYYISGDFQLRRQRLSILNPSMELVSNFPVNTARIIPVYRETKGLKSFTIRKFIKEALPVLDAVGETLPAWLVEKFNLPSRVQAVTWMHFPTGSKSLKAAQKRLGFEEVFELSLASLLNRYELLQDEALAVPFDETLAKQFVAHLPFTLTDAQRKVIWQVYKDIQKTQPMNRLVEGDVGSGKTVVAAMAAVMALQEGFQVAMMAPTELLARQHAETIHQLLEPLKLSDTVGLLVGGMKPVQKKQAQASIASGDMRFIVGTHALLQEKVDMHRLGLIVIDEQHRFGVDQRKTLQAKAGHAVHVLNMTATPIPRTLALTLYGELDISIIDTKPAGRKPIITHIASPNSRKQLYEKVDAELEAGRQMFVVCPQIAEQDESGAPASKKIQSAEAIFKELSTKQFKHRRVGLVHGKMKPTEKDAVMQQYVNHELDILVSTTVIEVGVNVPNATIMIVESAERFGLAQIHQLRGRVGRSEHQGYCYLVMSDSSAPSTRLKALESSSDGFKLAELDLEIRGPGAIYGSLQHGQLDLRVANLSDVKLIAAARNAAQEFIDNKADLPRYRHLYQQVTKLRAVTNLN